VQCNIDVHCRAPFEWTFLRIDISQAQFESISALPGTICIEARLESQWQGFLSPWFSRSKSLITQV
jgi:hypothetical protein